MNAKTLTDELDAQSQNIEALTKLWNASFGSVNPPPPFQFHLWLSLHPFDRVVIGLKEAAKTFCREGGGMSQIHLVRFASKVMNGRKAINQTKKEDKECLTK